MRTVRSCTKVETYSTTPVLYYTTICCAPSKRTQALVPGPFHCVPIRLSTTVCEVRPDPAFVGGESICPAYGEVLYANLVGADCMKSKS